MLVCVCATLGCTVFNAVSMVSCDNIDAKLHQSFCGVCRNRPLKSYVKSYKNRMHNISDLHPEEHLPII